MRGRGAGSAEGSSDAGWEQNRRHKFVRALAATPAQRMAWLEEMIVLAHGSGALPRPRAPDGGRERTARRAPAFSGA